MVFRTAVAPRKWLSDWPPEKCKDSDLKAFVDHCAQGAWNDGQIAAFDNQVKEERQRVISEAEKELSRQEGVTPTKERAEEYACYLMANGHVFMGAVAKAFVISRKGKYDRRDCDFEYQKINNGMYDSFELASFRQTAMFKKLEGYCNQTFGRSIFRMA